MYKVESFGEVLRKMRAQKKMPLRELAALLDIDTSTLSKIERNERNANMIMIRKLANIFNVDKKELQVSFMSDKVVYDLIEEDYGTEILQVAEKKIAYLKK